jgi:putative ABC transport system permease protein
MHVAQSILIALDMLRLHKLRAFLTMLGVIIGVMSVTIIVMVSSGFQYYMASEFKKLGSDTIIVMFDPGRQRRGQTTGGIEGLRNEDVQFLRDQVSVLDVLSPVQQLSGQKVFVADKEVPDPRVFATDENFPTLNRMTLLEGRYLSAADLRERANVCMIGEEIRDRLFPEGHPLGKYVSFKGITLEVVGVLERLDIMGQTTARDVIMPITTAQDKWIGGRNIMMITTRPKDGIKVDDAMDAVWQALMRKSNNRPIYRVDSRESILKVFGAVFGVAGIVLAAIAALSLLVGGIGIMNIMLVSVTERTREIGLRKAVGANRTSILSQFLVEAATLSLVGGLIGMGLAWGLGSLVTLITATKSWPSPGGLPTPFPVPAAIGAALFSAMIGVVFGLYPAISASRLDPIEALRRE